MARGNGWLVQPVTEKKKSNVAVTIDGVRHEVEHEDALALGTAVLNAAVYGWAE